jgi:hypothetical protein
MILSNAFDKQYYSPYFSTLSVGEPRTLTASVTVRFGGKD